MVNRKNISWRDLFSELTETEHQHSNTFSELHVRKKEKKQYLISNKSVQGQVFVKFSPAKGKLLQTSEKSEEITSYMT